MRADPDAGSEGRAKTEEKVQAAREIGEEHDAKLRAGDVEAVVLQIKGMTVPMTRRRCRRRQEAPARTKAGMAKRCSGKRCSGKRPVP